LVINYEYQLIVQNIRVAKELFSLKKESLGKLSLDWQSASELQAAVVS
jgi:hypothetical protein